jgi:hypothetical protein
MQKNSTKSNNIDQNPVMSGTYHPGKKKKNQKRSNNIIVAAYGLWSHRESNTGRSRIFAGLTRSQMEPQATVIPLHYRTDDD